MGRGLQTYWADVEMKINMRTTRIKRRSRVVNESSTKGHVVKVPGMWIAQDQYAKDTGHACEQDGLGVFDVEDPLTGKQIKACFIPKHRPGYFEGEFVASKKVKMTRKVDDDEEALREGQVQQSFQTEANQFTKSLPTLADATPTVEDFRKSKEINAQKLAGKDWPT